MDEGLLGALLRVPGVGKRRARSLLERFPTLEALRAASVDEIGAVPGIGPDLAGRLKDFALAGAADAEGSPPPPPEAEPPPPEPEAPPATPREQDWLKDFVEIAALIVDVPLRPAEEGGGPRVDAESPEPPPPEEDRPEKPARPLGLCPECGALFAGREESCTNCGVVLVDAMDTSPEVAAATGEPWETHLERNQAPLSAHAAGGLAGRTGPRGTVTRGPGRVNGLSRPPRRKEGMTNGLVNGTGATNGRAPSQRFRPGGSHSHPRSVRGLAILVGLLFLIVGAALLIYTPPPPGGIAIDGQFGDWAGVPRFDDTPGDSSPDHDLLNYRVRLVEGQLFVYARLARTLWGVPDGHTQSVFVFVDEDGDAATGFQIGGIGAEDAAEFYGWAGTLAGSQAWRYDDGPSPASDDWRSLRTSGILNVASADNQVEARVVPGSQYDIDRARILVQTWSTLGQGDAADALVGRANGALAVSQRTIAPEVSQGIQEPFLAFSLRPLGATIRVDSVTIREYGSLLPSAVTGTLFLDQSGDGIIDPTDLMLSTAPFSPEGTFAVARTLNVAESYVLRADFLSPAPQASVGFRVVAVSPDTSNTVPVTIDDGSITMSYIEAAPTNVTIDGAFAEWSPFPTQADADNDVQSVLASREASENIDIRAYQALVDANVSVYLRVDGRLLGGVDIPNFRGRFDPPPFVDSDGDTVPDPVELALGGTLAQDFNNDNISDTNQLEDVDQDGVLDYNKCYVPDCSAHTDYWLEATLPLWYPPEYGGKPARRYVGPVSLPPQRGIDTALVYVDRDNRTDTGLLLHMDGTPYGMDYAYQAVGRGGSLLEAGLYAHNANLAIPWEKVANVATGIDAHRLEAAFDATLVNLAASHTFVFATTDWRSNIDSGLGTGARSAPRPTTRSADDPRVFDIPGNEKLYLRNGNHTTETACTTNKVTSSTPGPGPAVSIVLRAGQSACWYADSTSGTVIPAGDWEALLDLFLSHGIAVYGEGSVSTPRYRESDGLTFDPEGSAPVAAATVNWVVVASSPTSPEKVVGVLSSNAFLYVQTWDGAVWTSNWNTDLGSHQTRKFDVAYEGQSGDVVIAFGDSTAQLHYRKRVAGTWDSTNGNAGAPLADRPFWVRLTPHPTNDDIMAAVSTNADTLHALRWNGAANAWGDEIQNAGLLASKDQEAFDVAYERASGDAFLIWGNNGGLLRYREFISTWGNATTAYTLPNTALWVTAATDPEASSNRIAVGMSLNNDDFEFGAWTGTSWVARPPPVGARDKTERGIDVGFEATSNRAMFVFNPSSNPGRIGWRTWTESGGFGGVNVELGTTGNVNFVQLRPDPRSNAMMLLYGDMNNDLFHRRWSGASWSALGTALETSLSETSRREAFMFAWTRVVDYDVYLEIWDKTTNSVVETIGSCLNGQAYGDDVQCLVSGVGGKILLANQVVRLRLVHSSPGGAVGILLESSSSAGDSRATIPSTMIPEFETLAVPVFIVLLVLSVRGRFRSRKGNRADRTPLPLRKEGVAADSVPRTGGR